MKILYFYNEDFALEQVEGREVCTENRGHGPGEINQGIGGSCAVNDLYKQYAEKLLQSDQVYRCFCSTESITIFQVSENLKKNVSAATEEGLGSRNPHNPPAHQLMNLLEQNLINSQQIKKKRNRNPGMLTQQKLYLATSYQVFLLLFKSQKTQKSLTWQKKRL
ncbi:hypothetical protein L2E82_29879 [Cichorium intybus]|uniref:Uncharacterized protein n=1 Tax=Cichorium intybus TaxID=13427 RepID=A0ACB9CYU3_CICIN|nr:hypothetical protein L2E82_29879 [Cichorium intybus]